MRLNLSSLNITGILKDVFLTYAGFIFFDDVQPTPYILIGLGLSFIGAIKCVHSKHKAFKAEKIGDVKDRDFSPSKDIEAVHSKRE